MRTQPVILAIDAFLEYITLMLIKPCFEYVLGMCKTHIPMCGFFTRISRKYLTVQRCGDPVSSMNHDTGMLTKSCRPQY